MENDTQKLQRLRDEGYRITKIQILFNKEETPSETMQLTLKKEHQETVLTSSETELFSYVIHLKSIPHIKDDNADFVYIEDTNRYFELEQKIINLLRGQTTEFIINEVSKGTSQKDFKKIMSFQRNWILSEKDVRMFNTKLCQIFYDIGILYLRGKDFEFKIVSKEKINLSDIKVILSESLKTDLAICFSAIVIGPNLDSKKEEKSDAIIGLLVYDLKNQQTLSLNISSLRQFQRRISNVGHHGLWECVKELHQRSKNDNFFRSYLPLPINLKEYTPLPWICLAFIKGIKEEIIVNKVKLDLPLFLAFGTPLLLDGKPSYDFDSDKQRALVMLGFREKDEHFLHQVRFDMSKGERNLHIDYQIFPEKGFCYKIVGHSVINYKDIWNFNENLAIGFLLAAIYDVNFEKLVVPNRLDGIDEAFRDNPLTIYPLFVRGMAGIPFRLVEGDSKLISSLYKIAKRETVDDLEAVKILKDAGLVQHFRLTILDDIVYARLLQAENKQDYH